VRVTLAEQLGLTDAIDHRRERQSVAAPPARFGLTRFRAEIILFDDQVDGFRVDIGAHHQLQRSAEA